VGSEVGSAVGIAVGFVGDGGGDGVGFVGDGVGSAVGFVGAVVGSAVGSVGLAVGDRVCANDSSATRTNATIRNRIVYFIKNAVNCLTVKLMIITMFSCSQGDLRLIKYELDAGDCCSENMLVSCNPTAPHFTIYCLFSLLPHQGDSQDIRLVRTNIQ
jgi:hypothetical protein